MENKTQLQKKMDEAWDNSIIHTLTTEFIINEQDLSKQVDTARLAVVYDMEPAYKSVFTTLEGGISEGYIGGPVFRIESPRYIKDVTETEGDVYLIRDYIEEWFSERFSGLYRSVLKDYNDSSKAWWYNKPKTEDIIYTLERPTINIKDTDIKVEWMITPAVIVFGEAK